jgi:hypothetical protein
MGAFSTQTSIESRISAARLVTIAGFGESTVNANALQSAIDFAWSHIAGRLRPTFGTTEIDTWVLPDDVPKKIANISDSLCILQLFVIRPDMFPEGFSETLETLDSMIDEIIDNPNILYEVDFTSPIADVDSLDSVFDDDDNTSNSYPVDRTWL